MHLHGTPIARRTLLTRALCAALMTRLGATQAGPPAATQTATQTATQAATQAATQTAAPDTRAIIDALLPTQTRSARNLLVRHKPDPAAEAASAGVSAAPSAAPQPAPAAMSPAASAAHGPPPSLALAIQFEPNSARVRPESGAVLGSLVAAMQSPELKASRFLIEGHADARGQAAQNQRLSQERADEVRLYLVALGVHPARLRALGKGASQLADAVDPTAAANRRVRVVTLE